MHFLFSESNFKGYYNYFDLYTKKALLKFCIRICIFSKAPYLQALQITMATQRLKSGVLNEAYETAFRLQTHKHKHIKGNIYK